MNKKTKVTTPFYIPIEKFIARASSIIKSDLADLFEDYQPRSFVLLKGDGITVTTESMVVDGVDCKMEDHEIRWESLADCFICNINDGADYADPIDVVSSMRAAADSIEKSLNK